MKLKVILKYAMLVSVLYVNHNLYAQEIQNFELSDLSSENQSFDDLKGDKLTLIDFWATWCSPCKKAIPELNLIYSDYKDKGVEIIGINCDGPRSVSKVKPFSAALKIKYPILLDINSELMNELNLFIFPTLIIINSVNEVIWVHEGYSPGDSELIRNAINKFLQSS